MAEIYHSQMNNPEHTAGSDDFRPRNQDGSEMDTDTAMNKLREEANRENVAHDAEAVGRERLRAAKSELSRRAETGVKACSNIYKGTVQPLMARASGFMTRLTERAMGADVTVKAIDQRTRERNGRIIEAGKNRWSEANRQAGVIRAGAQDRINGYVDGIKDAWAKAKAQEHMDVAEDQLDLAKTLELKAKTAREKAANMISCAEKIYPGISADLNQAQTAI